MKRLPLLAVCLMSAAALAGCHRDPKAQSAKAVARGDQYAAQQQFPEAIIEYRRALQWTPDRAEVHMRLGKAYADANDAPNAYAEYMEAVGLEPSRVDAQVAAGTLLLGSGEFSEAKARADAALAADPHSVPARILLGNALAGLKDVAQATRQMEQAVALDPTSPEAYAALGSVQFAAGSAKARASFEKAVALQPTSVDARIALANYYWASGDRDAAEADLSAALTLAPDNAQVHRALALIYLSEHRPSEAEPHFKALAARSAQGRLALADFYAGIGRMDDALALLRPMETDQQLGRIAQIRVATLLRESGHRDEAIRTADSLIAAQPSDADGHTLKARLLLSSPADPAGAWNEASAAVSADPGSASAQYTLGLAAAARRDYDRAEAAFAQTLNLNPNAVSADLALAKLRLARGDSASALNAAEDAVNASPDDPAAVFVLARSLRGQGDLDRARRELTTRLDKAPDAPELEPLWTELAHVELSAKKPDAAQAAFDRARAITPSDPALETLAAQIEIASHDTATAETQLLDIVRRDPGRLDAYELLAALYVQQGNAAAALDKYRALAARAPDQSGPATMIGILLEAAHDPAGARAQYEAVLARDPKAGVAANNLAWMLAQDGQYDQALRWAQASTGSLRGRPEPLDTLGWIRLKLNQPTEALAAFEKAVALAPGNATYLQHRAEAKSMLKGE